MKSQRQAKILEIISTRNVETQEQLLAALQKEGFRGTQATISRDIKELRIVKELTNLGTYRYTTPSNEMTGTFSSKMNTIFRECVVGYDYAQNIIVIRTLPGLASALLPDSVSLTPFLPMFLRIPDKIPMPLESDFHKAYKISFLLLSQVLYRKPYKTGFLLYSLRYKICIP